MAGTDLVVAQRGVMSIDIRKVNYGLGKSVADKFINAVGGSSFKKSFPGERYIFKKGDWLFGKGDTAKVLKDGYELVFNIPNMMTGWVKWVDKKPTFSELRFPAAGDEPIERESLGDLDQDEWDLNDRGEPDDPWKAFLVFPVRDEDGETVDHVMLTAKSAVIAGFHLFRDIMEEMSMHIGELPVIALGSTTASRDVKSVDKKGKEKTTKQSWDVPVFTPKGWVAATEIDNPAKEGGVEVTAPAAPAKLGKVESKARTTKEQKALPKPAAKSNGKRRAVEVDDSEL